jgi:phosphatidylglycerophosphatase A
VIVFKPTAQFATSHPAHLIAFGFGVGLFPRAPGTFGTLLAWPIGWLLLASIPATVLVVLVGLLFLVGVWACGLTGRRLGVHDHGGMVWDEFVAFLLMLAVLPAAFGWQAAAFVLFRLFDIVKPPPIRWIERRHQGGFGVMFDDVVAAGLALFVLALAKRMFF